MSTATKKGPARKKAKAGKPDPLTDNMRELLKKVAARKTPKTAGATTAAEGAIMGGIKYALRRLAERGLVKESKGEPGGWALTKAGAAELRNGKGKKAA